MSRRDARQRLIENLLHLMAQMRKEIPNDPDIEVR
jgi:hypothetical protein